ncbi:50S ribosomal protein P1 [Candidatus Micrarchaeota archaeon]|nr:50S ribosomal protein P1 [Candidatus Micrarchaeota archaeon]
MEYVYAALLLHQAKKDITEDGVIGVIKAAGLQADNAKAKALVSSLQGVNIEEAIKSAAMPVAVAAPQAAQAGAHAGGAAKEEKKEEKKTEEEAQAGLASLFG